MKTGIYILKFEGTDKVYVGQAVDINRRYSIHLRKLRAGTGNYKMQKAFISFGIPTLEILCECTRDMLNTNEAEAFGIFNSIDNGFNIAKEPDIHLEGPLNGAAKYTREEIIQVFNLLLDINNRYVDIALDTGVSNDTVRHIANSESHTWLSMEFPEKYASMVSLGGITRQSAGNSAISKGIIYPPILSPESVEYVVSNASEFAKEHGLDSSSLVKVLKRRPKYNTHKGWKLK